MSFFSSPSKYLREALEARRNRQRAEAHQQRQRQNQQQTHPGHEERQQQQQPNHPEASSSTIDIITTQWRSISDYFPNIFVSKEYQIETLKDSSSKVTTTIDNDDENDENTRTEATSMEREASLSNFFDEEEEEKKKVNLLPPPTTNRRMKSQLRDRLQLCFLEDGDDDISKDWYFRGRRDISDEFEHLPFGQPESIPSEPIMFSDQSDCWGPFRCHRYAVQKSLARSCRRQSRFLKRVMAVVSAEYAFLIFWVCLVMFIPKISEPIVKGFNFSYLPLIPFILSKLILRTMVKIRKLENWVLIVILCIRIICIAYYCAAVAVFAKTEIILLTGILCFLSHMFFTVTPNYVDYEVGSSEIVGMAAVVNLTFSVLIVPAFTICMFETKTLFNILVLNWLPSFIASQIIIMFLIFDMKQIMTGWRFPLAEADWIFTVLYL